MEKDEKVETCYRSRDQRRAELESSEDDEQKRFKRQRLEEQKKRVEFLNSDGLQWRGCGGTR